MIRVNLTELFPSTIFLPYLDEVIIPTNLLMKITITKYNKKHFFSMTSLYLIKIENVILK